MTRRLIDAVLLNVLAAYAAHFAVLGFRYVMSRRAWKNYCPIDALTMDRVMREILRGR